MNKRGQQIDLWQMAGFGPVDGTATQNATHHMRGHFRHDQLFTAQKTYT